jgi:hypothetical protein
VNLSDINGTMDKWWTKNVLNPTITLPSHLPLAFDVMLKNNTNMYKLSWNQMNYQLLIANISLQ